MTSPIYPDLGRWHLLSKKPEVYTWSRSHERFFDLRMIAVRLKDQSLLIYSPLPLKSDQEFRDSDLIGRPSHLLAPNHFHNLGVKPYCERYQNLSLLAAPQAAKRLKAVTSLTFADCAAVAPLLPDTVQVVLPEGLRTGEVWLTIDSSDRGRILVVCDSYFNMPPRPRGLFGLVLKLTGGAPGLKVSKVFGLLAIRQRAVYRQWLRTFFEQWQPTTLVPSHGAIMAKDSLGDSLGESLGESLSSKLIALV